MFRRPVIRDLSVQGIAQYVSVGARMLRGFALAAMLAPASLGAVALMNLLLALSQYADLGMFLAASREVSIDEGRGAPAPNTGWVWYGVVGKLVGGTLFLIGCLTYAAWVRTSDVYSALAATAAGVAGLAIGVATAIQYALQAQRRFAQSAPIVLVFSVSNLVLSLVGVGILGLTGVFIAQVISAVAALLVALRMEKVRPSALSGQSIRRLLVLGIPLAMATFMGFGLENIDQVMILTFLDSRALGIYSLVLAAGSALYLVPMTVSSVVGPRLLRAYGEHPSVEAIFRYTWYPVRVLGSVLPLAVLTGWLIAPWAIVALLPQYVEAIAPLRVYLVGMFFLGMALGTSSALVALEKHAFTVGFMAVGVCVNVVLDIALLKLTDGGLTAVAFGSLVTYAIYSTLQLGFVRLQFGARPSEALLGALVCVAPGAMLVAYGTLVARTGSLGSVQLVRDALALTVAVLASGLWWKSGIGDGWRMARGVAHA